MLRRITPALAAVALLLAACGGSGPAIEDPREIVAQGLAATSELTTVHLVLALDGTADVPQLGGSELTLDGTTVEGDVDLADSEAHLSFTAMGFTGELIQAGGDSYLKTPLTGPSWVKSTAAAGDPVSEVTDPAAMLQGVRDFLDDESVEVEKLSDTDCGDGRCYAVRLTVPASAMAGAGDVAGVDPAELVGDGLVLDLLFDRDDLWLAGVSTQVDAQSVGSLTLRLTLSDFNADVSVDVPSPDEVTEGGGSLFGF